MFRVKVHYTHSQNIYTLCYHLSLMKINILRKTLKSSECNGLKSYNKNDCLMQKKTVLAQWVVSLITFDPKVVGLNLGRATIRFLYTIKENIVRNSTFGTCLSCRQLGWWWCWGSLLRLNMSQALQPLKCSQQVSKNFHLTNRYSYLYTSTYPGQAGKP